MTQVLLISGYEGGHQPLGLAAAAAALRQHGHTVFCLDLAVQAADLGAVAAAKMIAISVPMHTGARLGVAMAKRARQLNPSARIIFYGLYAPALAEVASAHDLADAVVGGEYEPALCAIADGAVDGALGGIPGTGSSPQFHRQRYPVPDRSGLPPLHHYAHLDLDGDLHEAGYVEATRGCAHRCTHCPLTPTYAGRLRLVQRDTVLTDIANQVSLGAQHITFGDPDFLNAVPHSLAIVEAIAHAHPGLTWDATIKVEHLMEHAAILPQLHDFGCAFITSAYESVDDLLLRILKKGHTQADMERSLAATQAAGIPLRPTWMAFTPWTSLQDFLAILQFIETSDLVQHVQPVQYGLRLLLPPGSPLIEPIRADGFLTRFDEDGLTYRWRHPDPEVDTLQTQIAEIAKAAATDTNAWRPEDVARTFARVKQATLAALGESSEIARVDAGATRAVPSLTEAWFC